VREVTLSALLAADLCLSDVTAAAPESAAAAESATPTHPGVAPPTSKHSLLSRCPSVADPVCLALKAHGPTPSAVGSFSSSARLPPTLPLVACHL
jgi:hypothetical protein